MTVKTRKMPPLVKETSPVLNPDILYITYEELQEIIYNNMEERFITTFNSIPQPEVGETDYDVNNYIEDDGRQLRTAVFKDKKTNKEYSFGYVWSQDYGYDFPYSMFNKPEGVEFVENSVLATKKTIFEKAPIKRFPLDAKRKKNRLMMRLYNHKKFKKVFDIKITEIPDEKLFAILTEFQSMKNYSMFDLQDLLIPICLEYQIDSKNFWAWIRDTKTFKVRKIKKPKTNTKEIVNLSEQLVNSLIERYNIKSYDDFTCPIIEKMARELKVFG